MTVPVTAFFILIAIFIVGWWLDTSLRILASAVSEVAIELRWLRKGDTKS